MPARDGGVVDGIGEVGVSEIDVTGDRGTSRLWGPEFIAELVAPFEFIRKI